MLAALASLIAESGQGTYGADLFVGRLPSAPDNCVGVTTYQGLAPQYVHERGDPLIDRASFQVLIRSQRQLGLLAAESKAYAIWTHLASVANRTVGSTHFLAILPYQSPFEIPSDDNERFLYVFNGEARIRR